MFRIFGSILIVCWWTSACHHPPDVFHDWCLPEGALDLTCQEPHCVAAVVVDYRRLEPRGYRIFSLAGSPIDTQDVEAKAIEHVTSVNGAPPPDQVDSDRSGDFFNCFLRYNNNDSWLVVVHIPSGQVVFAGLEIWANQDRNHDFPLPEGFLDAAPLGCTDGALEPMKKDLITTGIPVGSPPASTSAQAWAVVKRLNLTQRFTTDHKYRVMVISYSPATGEFDPAAADWYVWLTLAEHSSVDN